MKGIKEKRAALTALYVELEKGQEELEAGGVAQARGEELEVKAQEAETLQKEVDQYERISKLGSKAKDVEDVILPAGEDNNAGERKGARFGKGIGPDGSRIVGYISLGDRFANSPEFKAFQEAGFPQANSAPMGAKSLHEAFVPVTEKMVEQKAVPTIGATVIQPDRIPEIVRTTELTRLRMRDVLDVSRTSSNSVEYVTVVSAPNAATAVTEAAVKPEASMELGTANSPVRTLAVHIPVTEQMLSDIPQIAGLINGELLFDLRRLEERQFLWGSGAAPNLQGILPLAGVPSITRAAATLLDRIRVGITDVMLYEYEPNAVVIHPLDWEGIVLLKGTDNRYVWTVVTDPQTGNSRVWGLAVVETPAMQKPTIGGGNTIYERDMLVGDFRRGATVWDREQASVQVGWINDQFTKNLRTIRAEERLAFGIKRPKAFAKYVTQAEAP